MTTISFVEVPDGSESFSPTAYRLAHAARFPVQLERVGAVTTVKGMSPQAAM